MKVGTQNVNNREARDIKAQAYHDTLKLILQRKLLYNISLLWNIYTYIIVIALESISKDSFLVYYVDNQIRYYYLIISNFIANYEE